MFGLVVGVGSLSGCLSPQPRACAGDSECLLDGRSGQCEPTSYCSYGNSDCASGRSYGPYAGGGLAGVCLDEEDATTSDGPPTSTDASTTASSMSTSSMSTSSMSSGGQTESSGCVENCDAPSVELLGEWDVGGQVVLSAASSGQGESILVAGAFADAGSDAFFAAELAAPDEVRWLAEPALVADPAVESIVRDPVEGVWVAGNRGVEKSRPFALRLDARGLLSKLRSWSTLDDDQLVGMGVGSGGVVVGGRLWGRPWLEAIDDDGATTWVNQWDAGPSDLEPARLHVGVGGLAVVLGARPTEQAPAMRLVLAGGVTVSDRALELGGGNLLASSAGNAGFGIVFGPVAAPQVALVTYDARVAWVADIDFGAVEAVAVDNANRILVVGGERVEAALFDATGTRRWTTVVDERSSTGLAALESSEGEWNVIGSLAAETELLGWRISG